MKQKLLLIVEAMGGGVRRHVVDLIHGLDKDRFSITLLYGSSRADATYCAQIDELKKDANLIESLLMVREIRPKADWQALKEIKEVIRCIQPDIVHCHSSKAGVLGRLAAKKMSVQKIFYTPHAYSFQASEFSSKKKFVFVHIERWLSRNATTKTFNVSKGERACALEHNLDKPEKFEVIYNGIPDVGLPDKKEERKKLKLPEDVFVAGVAARLNEQKDPFTFVKIAQKVVDDHPNAHFVYAGDGPLFEPVSQYIQEHSLSENVHLLGYRNDAEQIVSAFDLYLLTSLYEGLPYSLIESLHAGVPIVATRTIGNDEIVVSGENGELFDVRDVEQGAEYVTSFINGQTYSTDDVKKVYLRSFSFEKMIHSIEKQYLL